jgi:hypothetical protein
MVIPPRYCSARGFVEGLAAVSLTLYGTGGFIDRVGRMVIEPKYDCVDYAFRHGLLRVGSGRESLYLDKLGREVFRCERIDEVDLAMWEGCLAPEPEYNMKDY